MTIPVSVSVLLPCSDALQCARGLWCCILICLVYSRVMYLSLTLVLAMQGMKVKMKDMASKLGLGGAGNPFGALGQ